MVHPQTRSGGLQEGRVHRLYRFALWAAFIGFTFSTIDLVVFLWYNEIARGILSAVTLGVAVSMLVARAFLNRGRILVALHLMVGSLIVGVLIVAVVNPSLFPTAVLVPLIAVALALPYLEPRAMRKFLLVSLAAMALIAILGYYLEPPFGSGTRDERPLQVLSLVASSSLFLYLLFQHNQRLKETLDRLKELDAVKTQFLNTAAHELNTPMTPLKLQLRMLRTAPERLNPEQERSLEILERNVDRLSVLVQNVLEVARLQSGKIPLKVEPVDLSRLVRESVESFTLPAKHAGIQIGEEIEPGLATVTDRSKVSQVIYNLLSNALKFTPRGGRVIVQLARQGNTAELRVADTGIGLTAAQIDRLFQPFVQVHTESEFHAPGTGLGLFIAKGTLDQLGGQITVASPGPGKGSTFSAILPVSFTVRPSA